MITRNTDYSIQRLRGLSTDTKPTDVPNGSEFREMDTGKKFLYSAAGTEWIEQQGSGGGSGGGGTGSMEYIGELECHNASGSVTITAGRINYVLCPVYELDGNPITTDDPIFADPSKLVLVIYSASCGSDSMTMTGFTWNHNGRNWDNEIHVSGTPGTYTLDEYDCNIGARLYKLP